VALFAVVNVSFEIFCSYAHGDNDQGWVDAFSAALSNAYRKLTGERPRVFMDRESLMTADVWERKIAGALSRSQVLVAVISPSYVRSEWCRREWGAFAAREAALRQEQVLSDEQGLIFPILLYPLGRGRFGDVEQGFARSIAKRQWLDVSSQLEGTPIRPDQVRRLAEQIIDAISDLTHRRRAVVGPSSAATGNITIRDLRARIEWSAELSPVELSIDEAHDYLRSLNAQGSGGWRLPSREELESILDPGAIVDDPDASPYPLREPFNAQRAGYLHSGTPVEDAPAGHYVMNVRNGHIFNGHGYDGFVRAVRDLD
jgi:TIR domain/Protein of unknown function (DUF1566)